MGIGAGKANARVPDQIGNGGRLLGDKERFLGKRAGLHGRRNAAEIGRKRGARVQGGAIPLGGPAAFFQKGAVGCLRRAERKMLGHQPGEKGLPVQPARNHPGADTAAACFQGVEHSFRHIGRAGVCVARKKDGVKTVLERGGGEAGGLKHGLRGSGFK